MNIESDGDIMGTGTPANFAVYGPRTAMPTALNLRKAKELAAMSKVDPGIWDRIAAITNRLAFGNGTSYVRHAPIFGVNPDVKQRAQDVYMREMGMIPGLEPEEEGDTTLRQKHMKAKAR
jgi:hypothetical protein